MRTEIIVEHFINYCTYVYNIIFKAILAIYFLYFYTSYFVIFSIERITDSVFYLVWLMKKIFIFITDSLEKYLPASQLVICNAKKMFRIVNFGQTAIM